MSAYVGSSKNLKNLKNAFSAVLSTEGRVVGLCWAKLKPKGPKERPQGLGSFLWKGKVFAYVGFFQTLKDLKDCNSGALRISPVTCGTPPRVPKRSVGVVPRPRSPRAGQGITLLNIVRPNYLIEHSTTYGNSRIQTPINPCCWSHFRRSSAFIHA